MFSKITFSPLRSNVLDYVGKQNLQTSDGKPVLIQYGTNGLFTLTIGTETIESCNNLNASYFLNQAEVGFKV